MSWTSHDSSRWPAWLGHKRPCPHSIMATRGKVQVGLGTQGTTHHLFHSRPTILCKRASTPGLRAPTCLRLKTSHQTRCQLGTQIINPSKRSQIKRKCSNLILHHGFLHTFHIKDHLNEVLHWLGELGLGARVYRQLLYCLFIL